jgi:hypothetical protein
MPPFWSPCGRIAKAAAIALFATAFTAHATAVNAEYQLKAVFLFNFLQFVDWPADAFADAHSPIYVCVLGTDPFGSELDNVMAGERLDGRPIVVERHTDVAEITHCHLVFISQDSERRRRQSLAALESMPILTVGDVDDFAAQGGIIELDVQNNRIKLLVNLQAATQAQLRVSSKLLRKSQIVASGVS